MKPFSLFLFSFLPQSNGLLVAIRFNPKIRMGIQKWDEVFQGRGTQSDTAVPLVWDWKQEMEGNQVDGIHPGELMAPHGDLSFRLASVPGGATQPWLGCGQNGPAQTRRRRDEAIARWPLLISGRRGRACRRW